ncbi:MBL fold metallo-hydrolase [Mycobacterium asiaticum]|uniref:Metallo-beta-lactamase domain-containing protein n=1 Tax=Mycobacterium asiaticum TaxID=1790 RepID=A0A1A3KQF8_MYCAS|nr:MBL fold metallo-hydrolase [Mycobacterium asiaticum]OBJ86669.1 hypothetical protein A5640_09975 [Mycobacterium asiaticum]ORA16135.1 MBL fold metallo-hydrolase [Mycobacterium asiaticum DSM 44297]
MKVHHLNCGSMNVPGVPLVCYVLLVETDHGLVLVDTGFGLRDCADPARVGPFRHVMRPAFDPAETAAHQIEALGFRRTDVRHIVVTHFDFDHIGGISDFPDAFVHVTAAEARGAVHAPSVRERVRYRGVQWAHQPKLVEHSPDGEAWRGFPAAKPLAEVGDGVILVPMAGHTRGHAAVAVDAGSHWILHCGDAFYHHGSLERSKVPFLLRLQEEMFSFNRRQLHDNQSRLAELYERRDPDLIIVCAHDPSLLDRARRRA